ncbi:MAG TPA: TolC family protein, partial [Candidatus Acidoferrales bacterium]|nr:TolC family protein [Candidatus Acidoferrales bacterium]
MNKTSLSIGKFGGSLLSAVLLLGAPAAFAQDAGTAEKFTLKQAVALALRNSRELALARLQQTQAERAAAVQRAEFRPNLYAGSGVGYTNGMPQTPGGTAPSVFTVAYVQTLLNPPLRGQLRAAEERAEARRFEVAGARDAVIL